MRVLITGGDGMIGQEIAKQHLALGDEVYIYDAHVNPYLDYTNCVGTHLNENEPIASVLYRINPNIISHQAALVSVGRSQYNISDFVLYNVQFTADLLQAILDTKTFPEMFVHAGSMGPYGEGYPNFPITETVPFKPKSVYGVTKAAQEELIRVFSQTYMMPAVSLRYFSVYSTEQSPLNPYTGVLSIIGNQLLNAETVELYEDGRQTRDLINVRDVAFANLKAESYLDKIRSRGEPYFSTFNIGTGKRTTLLEIAVKMESLMGIPKIINCNRKIRAGDVHHIFANTEKANSILDWRPTFNLQEDIPTYCTYLMDNREKFTVSKDNIKEDDDLMRKIGLLR